MNAIVLRFLVLTGMLSATACARATEPWDAPFAGDPRTILEVKDLQHGSSQETCCIAQHKNCRVQYSRVVGLQSRDMRKISSISLETGMALSAAAQAQTQTHAL
jgi:hypothetical protein